MKSYNNIYTIMQENNNGGYFFVIPNAGLIIQDVYIDDVLNVFLSGEKNSILLVGTDNNVILNVDILEYGLLSMQDIYKDLIKNINDNNAALIILDSDMKILKSFSIKSY